MKLDKIKFARLIAFISRNGFDSIDDNIQYVDDLIDVDIPEAPAIYPNSMDINLLMALMQQGTQKIEAIKLYRKLTGWGLKESKDAVEKYWVSKPIIEKNEGANLGDILRTAKVIE